MVFFIIILIFGILLLERYWYELEKRFRKIGSDIRVSERRAQRLRMACLRKQARWAHSETFFLDTAHDAAPARIKCGELVEIERAGK